MQVVLCTGGYDHKIRLWDATSGSCTKALRFAESQVNCIQISPDKKLVAAGGNPSIHIYDIAGSSEAPILTLEGHTTNVTSIGFAPMSKWFFSSSEDGTIKVWDLRSATCQRTYDCTSSVNTAVLSPNQAEIISGDSSGFVKTWDLEGNALKDEFLPTPDVPVRSLSLSGDSSLLIVGTHKGRVFVYTSSELLREPDEQSSSGGGVSAKPFASPSPGALSSSRCWNPLRDFQAHEEYLLKCTLSPDCSLLATTSSDRSVKLWDTSEWGSPSTAATLILPVRSLTHHQRWVWDAVFSADSLYMVTVSSDQSAKLVDLQSGNVVRNYMGHNLAVTCVALNDSIG